MRVLQEMPVWKWQKATVKEGLLHEVCGRGIAGGESNIGYCNQVQNGDLLQDVAADDCCRCHCR